MDSYNIDVTINEKAYVSFTITHRCREAYVDVIDEFHSKAIEHININKNVDITTYSQHPTLRSELHEILKNLLQTHTNTLIFNNSIVVCLQYDAYNMKLYEICITHFDDKRRCIFDDQMVVGYSINTTTESANIQHQLDKITW